MEQHIHVSLPSDCGDCLSLLTQWVTNRAKLISKVNSKILQVDSKLISEHKDTFFAIFDARYTASRLISSASPRLLLLFYSAPALAAIFVPGDIKRASYYLGVLLKFPRPREKEGEINSMLSGVSHPARIWTRSFWFLCSGRENRVGASFEQLK